MLFGIVVLKWDFSLELLYHIVIVGGQQVQIVNGTPVLNQGAKQWCEGAANIDVLSSEYCEFELYFRQDVALALSVEATNIDVLFVKPSGEDGVIVSFRFIPPPSLLTYDTQWVQTRARDLVKLVSAIMGRHFILLHYRILTS